MQNKRNKRGFYFVDAVNDAISQQQRQQQSTMELQQQLQLIIKREQEGKSEEVGEEGGRETEEGRKCHSTMGGTVEHHSTTVGG